MGSTRFRKASLRSSSAPMRRSVSIRRLRSVSLSSPTRAPISAKVGSLRSSAPLGRILAEAALGNEADATPLRARKSEMVRMAPPQPDKTSRLIQTFPVGPLKQAAVFSFQRDQVVSNITPENVLATSAGLDPTWTQ